MRVVVFTQDDPFYTARNVERLCAAPDLEVVEVIVLEHAGAVSRRRRDLLRWFGPVACGRLALGLARARLCDAAHRLTGGRVRPHGVIPTARACGVPTSREPDANAPALLKRLRRFAPDVIVSFSAPQVFRPPLLELAPHGCLNLHSSLLPDHRGLLPSFRVLLCGEGTTGATVHRMSSGIDDGEILGQVSVDIAGVRTMHEVLRATKEAGGHLMVRVLREVRDGRASPRPNPVEEGRYWTWPTTEEARTFRARGYRLI
jgi:methionyl-tRNA formyltransferase